MVDGTYVVADGTVWAFPIVGGVVGGIIPIIICMYCIGCIIIGGIVGGMAGYTVACGAYAGAALAVLVAAGCVPIPEGTGGDGGGIECPGGVNAGPVEGFVMPLITGG